MRVSMALTCLLLAACAGGPPPRTLTLGASHIAYQQSGNGPPVAVFQSGLGDGREVWAGVIERVAPELAVFAYDRPGYGQSGSVPSSARDPCAVAHELHQALRAAGVKPPYVLVGHSIGGLYQYAYARLYPADVAAVLLVDPTHPDHWARMQREAPAAARVAAGMRAAVFTPAMRAEFDAQATPACDAELQAHAAPTQAARLLVRSRFGLAEAGAFESLVRRLEADWPRLLPGSVRQQVQGAGHYIQKDRPDVVAQELKALAQGVASVRR